MLFSSITFLYYFLPMVLIIYFIVPRKLKNGVLLIASIIFYAWGEPLYCILMLISILVGYGMGIRIESKKLEEKAVECEGKLNNRNKTYKGSINNISAEGWLIIAIVIHLSILAFFKYSDFFIENLNRLPTTDIPLLEIALPLGISFYTFHILSYIIDIYRGVIVAERNLLTFMTYATLFPQLVAGPIVRYVDIARQLHTREHSFERVYLGSRRFLVGLAKKVLIANAFETLAIQFQESTNPSVLFYWVSSMAFTLQIYYDFSGYSDMAIGLGRIFGFDFLENFNYPYVSRSITEFWRRWHISLSSWFRDYVYIPMGGNRVSKQRHALHILIVWMLTGLWHGAAWNFVLWGIYFGILLLIEKFIFPIFRGNHIRFTKLQTLFSHVYVMFFVILSFVIFKSDTVGEIIVNMKNMFGYGELPFCSYETLYYIKSYGVIFAIAIFGATPIWRMVGKYLENKKKLSFCLVAVEPIFFVGLLLLITGYLVDGSFHPFLYFRF